MKIELSKTDADLIAGLLDDCPWDVPVDPEFRENSRILLTKLQPLISRAQYKKLLKKIEEWMAWIHLDGWAGASRQAVIIVGETPKRYRIKPAGSERVRLAGRNRSIGPGDTALVPKHAVTKR